MMSLMSDATGERRSTAPGEDEGVLVNLPRTRPQRSSARRLAARETAQAARAANGAPAPTAERPPRVPGAPATAAPARGRAQSSPKRGAAKRPRRATGTREAVPRQGFEADGETMTGSVQPPAGAELVGSAVEIVGEIAKAGLSAGERLVKDVFSRLPRT